MKGEPRQDDRAGADDDDHRDDAERLRVGVGAQHRNTHAQLNPDRFPPAATAVAAIHIDTTLSAAPDVRPIIDAVHGALS